MQLYGVRDKFQQEIWQGFIYSLFVKKRGNCICAMNEEPSWWNMTHVGIQVNPSYESDLECSVAEGENEPHIALANSVRWFKNI